MVELLLLGDKTPNIKVSNYVGILVGRCVDILWDMLACKPGLTDDQLLGDLEKIWKKKRDLKASRRETNYVLGVSGWTLLWRCMKLKSCFKNKRRKKNFPKSGSNWLQTRVAT